jgi:hypothetical protein
MGVVALSPLIFHVVGVDDPGRFWVGPSLIYELTPTNDGQATTVSWPTSYAAWHAEISTNGTDWHPTGNTTANGDGYYYTTVESRPGQQFRIKP